MNKNVVAIALCAGMLLSVSKLPASAQSLTGNVGSAGFSEGDRAFETRVGFDRNGKIGSRVHYDHAFTEWYQLRIIAAFRRPDGADWDYSGLTVENWLQWSEEAKDQTGFNGGLRLAYTFADNGKPDEAALRATITDKFAEAWEWRANLIAAFEAGEGSAGGAELESRLQLTRSVKAGLLGTDDWRIGAELFSEYGNTRSLAPFKDQAHQIGPVIKASWGNGVYLQAAVRAGLTDGSDDRMAKVFIGRKL